MKKLCVLITAILFAICLVGCNNNGTSDNTATTTVTPSTATEATEVGYYQTDEDTFEIETKYGALHYPKKWESKIKTRITDGEPYSVEFIALDEYDEIPLFDIVFGETDEGAKLGKLEINGEIINVYLVDYSGDWPESVSDEGIDLFAMSEDANVLVSKLVYDSNMVLED